MDWTTTPDARPWSRDLDTCDLISEAQAYCLQRLDVYGLKLVPMPSGHLLVAPLRSGNWKRRRAALLTSAA